jgi:hypothetical protein
MLRCMPFASKSVGADRHPPRTVPAPPVANNYGSLTAPQQLLGGTLILSTRPGFVLQAAASVTAPPAVTAVICRQLLPRVHNINNTGCLANLNILSTASAYLLGGLFVSCTSPTPSSTEQQPAAPVRCTGLGLACMGKAVAITARRCPENIHTYTCTVIACETSTPCMIRNGRGSG